MYVSTTNVEGFIYYFGIFYLKIGKFYTFFQLGKGPIMGPKISPGKSQQCIFYCSNFTVTNTVISKKPDLRVNANGYVIYVQGEQQWTENGALRDTRRNRGPVRSVTLNSTKDSFSRKGLQIAKRSPFRYIN